MSHQTIRIARPCSSSNFASAAMELGCVEFAICESTLIDRELD